MAYTLQRQLALCQPWFIPRPGLSARRCAARSCLQLVLPALLEGKGAQTGQNTIKNKSIQRIGVSTPFVFWAVGNHSARRMAPLGRNISRARREELLGFAITGQTRIGSLPSTSTMSEEAPACAGAGLRCNHLRCSLARRWDCLLAPKTLA